MAKKEYNVITRTRAARSRSSGSAQSLGRQTATLITGGYTSATSGGSDGHSHGNKELLDALQIDEEKYVYLREYDRTAGSEGDGEYVSEKVKAGYADKAGTADDSQRWNGKEMAEMMDQPVRETDDVKHKSVTASGTVKGKALEGESLTVEKNSTVGGDASVTGDATVGGTATAQRVVATGDAVAPRLTTPTFREGGLTGEGGGMYTDETGLTHAEYDYIVARRGLVLSALTIEEINSVAGGIVASKAHGEVESVSSYTASDGSTRYVVYLKDVNMFQFGDLVRFARWDYTNNAYRWAWVPVRGCDTAKRFINIWASDLADGMSLPEAGDKLVQMGHKDDTARQGFVYITDSGMQCFDGVSTASLVGKCRGAVGDLTGITDNGNQLEGYGVWSDRMYIGTGRTVYETFTDIVASIIATNNALAEYKTEVTSQFNVVAGEMSSVQKAVTSLQTGGGRNLLLRTNRGVTNWGCLTNSASRPAMFNGVDGCVEFDYIAGNYATSYEIYVFKLRPELIVQGRTYTLTVEVLDTTGVSGLYFYLNIANNDSSGRLMYDVVADKPLMQEAWTRLAFTFTAISTGSAEGAQQIRLIVPQDKLGQLGFVSFRNLKLEEGDVATAYTAAPEDYVDGEITAVRETVSSIEQTTNEIKTRVEEVNISLAGRITANTSSITQNANSITSEVAARESGDEELRTMISQTADSISLKVAEKDMSNRNHAYGTGSPKVISLLGNSYNQTSSLYEVKGLSAGDKVVLSFIIRLKNVVFDDVAASNDTAHANSGPFISLQLDNQFGYLGWAIKLTEQMFSEIALGTDGYKTMKVLCKAAGTVPQQGYTWTPDGNIYHDITPDIVGMIFMRLDYIAQGTETDASGNLIESVIEISELKVEKGTECTAWTARTGDLETAMRDTGIDIGRRVIEATADNFRVLNNSGMVTAEVDENGSLTVNSVACRYGATSGATTPNMADWNIEGDGVIRWYYPNGSIRAEIGLDATTETMIRKYNEEGNLLWGLGNPAEFMTFNEPVWTPISLYYCGTDVSGVPRNTKSLVGTTYYRKTNTGDAKTNNTVYKSLGANPAVISDGWYTPPGVPMVALAENSGAFVGLTRYSRTAYYYESGRISRITNISWSSDEYVKQI